MPRPSVIVNGNDRAAHGGACATCQFPAARKVVVFLLSNMGKNLNGRSLWWDLSGGERKLLLGFWAFGVLCDSQLRMNAVYFMVFSLSFFGLFILALIHPFINLTFCSTILTSYRKSIILHVFFFHHTILQKFWMWLNPISLEYIYFNMLTSLGQTLVFGQFNKRNAHMS